jgi:hypothetical protein
MYQAAANIERYCCDRPSMRMNLMWRLLRLT